MVAHSFNSIGGLRRSLQVFTHTGAQVNLQNIFKLLKKLQASMPHATPKEMTLGEYPDPDLEVSPTQQRERFKRSLARVDVLDTSEISWLGAVARIQATTSTAMVRREQHKRFHEPVLSASRQIAQTCSQPHCCPFTLPSFHRRWCAQIHSVSPHGCTDGGVGKTVAA